MGSLRASAWLCINAPETIVNWILEGVPLHLATNPPTCVLQNRNFTWTQAKFVGKEVALLLQRDSIRLVEARFAWCVLPISVVLKKSGKLRLVLDCRHVNEHIQCPSFKQEGVDSVAQQISEGNHLVSIDLERGFHHLKLRPDQRKYVCFQWRGKIYQWVAMPFGLKCAPYLFSKTVHPVVLHFRKIGIRNSVWVDDFLFMLKPSTSQGTVETILSTFQELGWAVNFDKCDLQLTCSTTFVGFVLYSTGCQGPWLQVPRAKICLLRALINRVLLKDSVVARVLARIAGRCISMTRAIVPTKLLLHNVFRQLATKTSWESPVMITEVCRRDLLWWRQALVSWNGAPLLKPDIQLQIFTDASGSGWGGWSPDHRIPMVCGPWEMEVGYQHSNFKELLGVFRSLQAMGRHVHNKLVQIVSDNVTTVAYLNQLSGHTPLLLQLA